MTILSASLATPAFAATAPGQGLQLSPPLVSAQADPGATVIVNLKLLNISGGALVITATADDFGAGNNEDGKPSVLLGETTTTRYSLRQWVAPIAPLTLQPKQEATIPVKITLPTNAEPGGHYGVIRFSGTPPGVDGTGVAVSASIGALILFTVNGDITHHVSVVDSTVAKTAKNTYTLDQRLRNDGSVHEAPTGTITITDMFGKTVDTVAINDKKANVLPGSIRKFTEVTAGKIKFGRYTLKGTLTYANGKLLVLPVKTLWVIPWMLILTVFLVILVLAILLRLGLQRYNAYIIAQARRR